MSAMTGQVQIIKQTARTIGVELPKAPTKQVESANKLIAAAQSVGGTAELTAAVLTALANGSDFRDDPQIGRLAVAAVVEQLGISGAARARADSDIEDALVENSDTILGSWAQALQPHAQAPDAAEGLPTADLNATDTIVAAGPKAMALWAGAQGARKPWASAIQGFIAFAAINHVNVQKRSPLIICDNVDAIAAAEVIAAREGTPLDVWTIARAGGLPSLAAISTYMERSAMFEQQRQAAIVDELPDARRDEDQADDKQPRTAALA